MTLPHGVKLPKDEIETGSGSRRWINCTFYGKTMEEVAAKRKAYLKQYPPQGYDTHTVGNIFRHPDRYYFVRMKRWSTCD